MLYLLKLNNLKLNNLKFKTNIPYYIDKQNEDK